MLFVIMIPNITKRNIHELKVSSYLLFIGVLFLLITFLYKIVAARLSIVNEV